MWLLAVGSTLLLHQQAGRSTGRLDCDLMELTLFSVTEMYGDWGRAAELLEFGISHRDSAHPSSAVRQKWSPGANHGVQNAVPHFLHMDVGGVFCFLLRLALIYH